MIWRALAAVVALFAGLGLVIAAGPLRNNRRAEVAPRIVPLPAPTLTARLRGGLANGVPFSYKTSVSRLSPESLISEFKAQGLEFQSGDPDAGVLPPLQGFPESPGIMSAIRWSRPSPAEPPTPEVLLVFGRNPASTYQLQIAAPAVASGEYRPLQDLETRLGIFRSGLDIDYGILDKDGTAVFVGRDPGRRILAPGFSATMESAGWRPGLRNPSTAQASACFRRWNQEICFSRDSSGALLASLGPAGAILSTTEAVLPPFPNDVPRRSE